jgi:uncharacterized protein (DUF934 family)
MMRRIMNLQPTIATQAYPIGPAVAPAGDVEAQWCVLGQSAWLQVGEDGFVPDFPAYDAIVVPLALWQLRREDLDARSGPLGLLLHPHDDLTAIVPDLAHFELIILPAGRSDGDWGNKTAQALRERYGYQGELVAIVDMPDTHSLYPLSNRFDALVLAHDKDAKEMRSAGGKNPHVPARRSLSLVRRQT